QIAILICRQPGIQKHRNDAGSNRAPEQEREIDGIEQDQCNAIFALDAKSFENRTNSRNTVEQFRIGNVSRRIDESRLAAATIDNVTIYKIDGSVIVTVRAHHPRASDNSLCELGMQ